MKPLKLVLLSLILFPGLPLLRSPLLRGQDVTKPIIPVPVAPAQAPAPIPTPAPMPSQTPAPGAAQPPTAATSAAPTGPAPAKSAPGVTADYVIGPQDELMVSVFKDPTLSGNVLVRPDGMITLPLLDDVKAVDFTPAQLADNLTTRYKKFVQDPVLSVTVIAINSKFIFFAGEIHIGKMPYSPTLTPLQAIIEDGGPTAFAKKSGIYILRTTKGKQVKVPFNYKKAVKTGDQQGVTLLPGDVIVVP